MAKGVIKKMSVDTITQPKDAMVDNNGVEADAARGTLKAAYGAENSLPQYYKENFSISLDYDKDCGPEEPKSPEPSDLGSVALKTPNSKDSTQHDDLSISSKVETYTTVEMLAKIMGDTASVIGVERAKIINNYGTNISEKIPMSNSL